jgi:hypothetical protein
VDGYRTNYISRDELRLFLIGLRVPGMSDDRTFDAHWALVATRADGRIGFQEFRSFIKNLRPSHLKAVQTDLELVRASDTGCADTRGELSVLEQTGSLTDCSCFPFLAFDLLRL